MSSFSSILDKPANSFERPKPLPAGTYLCTVKGLPRFDKSVKKQTEYAEFSLTPVAIADDVNQDDLTAMGGLDGKNIRATFYFTENSMWRLTEFLTHLGLDTESGKFKVSELIEEVPNKQLMVTLRHTASQDGKTMYAEIASTAPAE